MDFLSTGGLLAASVLFGLATHLQPLCQFEAARGTAESPDRETRHKPNRGTSGPEHGPNHSTNARTGNPARDATPCNAKSLRSHAYCVVREFLGTVKYWLDAVVHAAPYFALAAAFAALAAAL